MHIALDSNIFGLQRFGGITTYWIELARGLAVAGDSTTLLLPRDLRTGRGAEIAALPGARQRERIANGVARYLRAPAVPGAAIQHASYYRLPAGGRAKRFVTVYDFIYERYRRGLARHVHSWQKKRAVEGADGVLCISEHTRLDLLTRWPQVDATRVVTVPLAVDHGSWFPGAGAASEEVVFVGQRGGYKRFDLVAAAVARLPDMRLAIVGPPLAAAEQAMLEQLLAGRWRVLDGISNAELRLLYQSAYALVFPSEYEGFGLPLLEAMACGCPVVAAHRSCLPEVGGDAVRWVHRQEADAYAQAILELGDTNCRVSAVAAGLARAGRFTWKRTVEETKAAYSTIA